MATENADKRNCWPLACRLHIRQQLQIPIWRSQFHIKICNNIIRLRRGFTAAWLILQKITTTVGVEWCQKTSLPLSAPLTFQMYAQLRIKNQNSLHSQLLTLHYMNQLIRVLLHSSMSGLTNWLAAAKLGRLVLGQFVCCEQSHRNTHVACREQTLKPRSQHLNRTELNWTTSYTKRQLFMRQEQLRSDWLQRAN